MCVCIAKISLGNSHESIIWLFFFLFISAAGASSTLFAILARAFPARVRQSSLVSAVRINVVAAPPLPPPVVLYMFSMSPHMLRIYLFLI